MPYGHRYRPLKGPVLLKRQVLMGGTAQEHPDRHAVRALIGFRLEIAFDARKKGAQVIGSLSEVARPFWGASGYVSRPINIGA
jgi:hypothetical protein